MIKDDMKDDIEFFTALAAKEADETHKEKVVPDISQLAAIRKTDNTVVAAGAGSGKTEVLALRYTYLLCKDDNLHVRNILALTFTKKAAGEIYARIHQKLSLAASLDKTRWSNEVGRAEDALREMSDAKIQTLDSYAGTIVRQAAGRYGIRPDFTTGASSDKIAEDLALPFVLRHREDACFNTYAAAGKIEDLAKDYFADPVQKYTSVATEPGYFKRCFDEQKREVLAAWNKLFCDPDEGLMPYVDEIRGVVFAAENELAAKSAKRGAKKEDAYVSGVKNALALLNDVVFRPADDFEAVDFAFETARRRKALSDVNSVTTVRGLSTKGGIVKELKAAVTALKDKIKELSPLIDSINEFIDTYDAQKRMFALMDEFLAEVNKQKRLTGSLSFKDVNDLALRALIEQTDIRREQKSLIKKIMIDEFQDNNGKNKNFLFLLSERDGDELEKGKDMSEREFFRELESRIAPDKLFFVGDEKQSIYKFRGADVAVFNELKSSLRGAPRPDGTPGDVKLSMTNNYRSDEALLYSFNVMFGNNEKPDDDESAIPSIFYHKDECESSAGKEDAASGSPRADIPHSAPSADGTSTPPAENAVMALPAAPAPDAAEPPSLPAAGAPPAESTDMALPAAEPPSPPAASAAPSADCDAALHGTPWGAMLAGPPPGNEDEIHYGDAVKHDKTPGRVNNDKEVRAHFCFLEASEIKERGDDALSANETLAYFITQRILYLHNEKGVPYEKCAVLERGRGKTRGPLQRFLSQCNIPYTLDRQTNIFSDGIVNDLYNFLRLCVYPADSTAFAAVLSSPFANISITGVENILAACTRRVEHGVEFTPFREGSETSLSTSDAEKYRALKALYAEQRDKILSQSITTSLEYLWFETGYRYETLLDKNLSMRATQYDLLYEVARRADADGRDVSWFVDQMGIAKRREQGARDTDDEELELGDITYPLEAPPAVQIMSIHQSKGLEFGYVFITGLEDKVKTDSLGQVFFDNKPFPPFNEATGVSLHARGAKDTWFYSRRKEEAKRLDKNERKRLIYVAVTRAIHEVYIVSARSAQNKSPLLFKLAKYYYPDELGDAAPDGSAGCASAGPAPSPAEPDAPAYKNKSGAPFDFIRIRPLTRNEAEDALEHNAEAGALPGEEPSAQRRAGKRESLDDARRKAISAQQAAYEKEPVSFKEFVDKSATPSSLESAEAASVPVPAGLCRVALYEKLDGILGGAQDEGAARKGITAAEFGDIVHAFMMTLVRTGSLSRAERNIKSELRLRLDDADVIAEKDKAILLECACDMCERFKGNALYKAAREASLAGRLCKAECGFKMRVGDAFLTGSIDLIFEGAEEALTPSGMTQGDAPDALTIVDYKTDRAVNPARYVAQQACYRLAAAEIYGVPVENIQTYLYYTQYGAALEITPYTQFSKQELLQMMSKRESSPQSTPYSRPASRIP